MVATEVWRLTCLDMSQLLLSLLRQFFTLLLMYNIRVCITGIRNILNLNMLSLRITRAKIVYI